MEEFDEMVKERILTRHELTSMKDWQIEEALEATKTCETDVCRLNLNNLIKEARDRRDKKSVFEE